MKKIYSILAGLLFSASLCCTQQASAQAPQKMSYQSVLRNSSNVLLANTQVRIKISVLQGTASGTAVYVETQLATTNGNGLLSIQIGTGPVTTGTFAGINWAAGPYFIKTETDPTGGTNYTITGTQEMLSVPYAMYAAKSGDAITMGAGPGISVTGTGTSIDPYVVSTKIYTIGLWPELGGYVFRISADGRHGLVAETEDMSNIASNWWLSRSGVENLSFHTPVGQNFMDWRLPTLFELNQMYTQRVAIGGFNLSGVYWTSTFAGSDANVFQVSFLNGIYANVNKSGAGLERAVRAF